MLTVHWTWISFILWWFMVRLRVYFWVIFLLFLWNWIELNWFFIVGNRKHSLLCVVQFWDCETSYTCTHSQITKTACLLGRLNIPIEKLWSFCFCSAVLGVIYFITTCYLLYCFVLFHGAVFFLIYYLWDLAQTGIALHLKGWNQLHLSDPSSDCHDL